MLSKSDIAKSIGGKLKAARENKHLTQEELAHSAGLYRTYIGHIETGTYMPSAYTIYKIVSALGVKSNEILPF